MEWKRLGWTAADKSKGDVVKKLFGETVEADYHVQLFAPDPVRALWENFFKSAKVMRELNWEAVFIDITPVPAPPPFTATAEERKAADEKVAEERRQKMSAHSSKSFEAAQVMDSAHNLLMAELRGQIKKMDEI